MGLVNRHKVWIQELIESRLWGDPSQQIESSSPIARRNAGS